MQSGHEVGSSDRRRGFRIRVVPRLPPHGQKSAGFFAFRVGTSRPGRDGLFERFQLARRNDFLRVIQGVRFPAGFLQLAIRAFSPGVELSVYELPQRGKLVVHRSDVQLIARQCVATLLGMVKGHIAPRGFEPGNQRGFCLVESLFQGLPRSLGLGLDSRFLGRPTGRQPPQKIQELSFAQERIAEIGGGS